MTLLRRDIGKNKVLLWLVEAHHGELPRWGATDRWLPALLAV